MSVVVSYYNNTESDAALQEAIRQAQSRQTCLVVVLKSGEEDSRESAAPNSDENDLVEDRLWDTLRQADLSFDVRRAPRGASMADTVLEAAENTDAAVIVIGIRPGGSRYAHIGPTAAQILLDAPCPVVTTTTRLQVSN